MTQRERAADRVEQFKELSLQHMSGLYSVAVQLTRRPDDAEDLVQEAYVRGFEKFDQFRPGTNFKAWIFTILRNAFITQYNRNKSRVHVELDSVAPYLSAPSGDDAIHARIDAKGDAFRRALQGVSPDARTMLNLAYAQGFTYKEIAQVMGCPIGTVMSRLFRARQHLQGQLQGSRHAPLASRDDAEAA